ncbi:MAG: nitroreductase family protein [Leptospirales bacterium]|nr:nitroreductase family protein [Leptospirales bacterium]
MDALECIMSRRSIRKYKLQQAPADVVQKVVEAGFAAPSAANQRPCHFIIIDDREILNKITETNPHAGMLAAAAFAVVICFDDSPKAIQSLVIDDCSAAAENMLLAATALGYGSVWIGIHHDEVKQKNAKAALKLPDGVKITSIIAVGVSDETPASRAQADPKMIHKNGW